MIDNKISSNDFDNVAVKKGLSTKSNLSIQYKKVADISNSTLKFCETISAFWNVKNGGPLYFQNILCDCDTIFYAKKGNRVVGYVGIKRYKSLPNSFYIEQIAVAKNYIKMGIGSKLLASVMEYTVDKNIKSIVANVRKDNIPSNNLFTNNLFSLMDMTQEQWVDIGFAKEQILNENAYFYNVE